MRKHDEMPSTNLPEDWYDDEESYHDELSDQMIRSDEKKKLKAKLSKQSKQIMR